jgi:hypothetical protein
MRDIPEPLRQVLRDYLHVEWYELNELISDIQSPKWNVSLDDFKMQLRCAIVQEDLSIEAIRQLTGHEFTRQTELTNWLSVLWSTLFKEPGR